MKLLLLLAVLSTFVALISATAVHDAPYVQHEKRSPLSPWIKRSRVSEDMSLPMRIGLRQSNLDKAHDILMDVSRPDSPNYGKWYSAEQVAALFAPGNETVNTVRTWLEDAGIARHRVSQSTNLGWLQFDASSAEAEQLLRTRFYYFEHAESGDKNIASDEYFVPEHVAPHIDYITPGIKLIPNGNGARQAGSAPPKRRSVTHASGPTTEKPLPPNYNASSPYLNSVHQDIGCDHLVSPACIRTLYDIPLGSKKAAGNELGIFETRNDAYSQSALDRFWETWFPDIPGGTGPEVRSIDGGRAPVTSGAGLESCLDLELAYPIIWPQGAVIFQTDDVPNMQTFERQGMFNNFLDAIDGSYCSSEYGSEKGNNPSYDFDYPNSKPGGYKGELQCGVYKPTNVISISWAGNEDIYPPDYQIRQCHEWLKLGLQGVTVVVASGDNGVGGFGDRCMAQDGRLFNPGCPSTCPYVTSVGSTTLPAGRRAGVDREVATTTFPSGGGFSNLWKIPDYQAAAHAIYWGAYAPDAVKAYKYYRTFTDRDPVGAHGGVYNREGRGYPDVAAVGDNIISFVDGELYGRGTSASAPIWAAIFTRINEERIAAGKGLVGHVNPVLYRNPEAFNDVVEGNNPGCQSEGFMAAKGWDPVTGLGTPKYEALLKVFMDLP